MISLHLQTCLHIETVDDPFRLINQLVNLRRLTYALTRHLQTILHIETTDNNSDRHTYLLFNLTCLTLASHSTESYNAAFSLK